MTTSADPAAAAPHPVHDTTVHDTTVHDTRHDTTAYDEGVLRAIAQRVLWLSAAIVDAANAGRANHSGVKVGGHQASTTMAMALVCSPNNISLATTTAGNRGAAHIWTRQGRIDSRDYVAAGSSTLSNDNLLN